MNLTWTKYGKYDFAEIPMTEGWIAIARYKDEDKYMIGYSRPGPLDVGNLFQLRCKRNELDETLEVFIRELSMGLKVYPLI